MVAADTGAITNGTATLAVGSNAPTTGTLTSTTANGWDIVYGFKAGDIMQVTGITLNGNNPVLTNGQAVVEGSVVLLKGTYSAATGFTVSATGTDSLYTFDANGTAAGTTFNAVVLIGYVDTANNDAVDPTGLTGFAG
jgi:hypothetical protein